MTTVYELKQGARLKAGMTPEIVGAELERLRKENGGTITPDYVLLNSKDPTSPLHEHFEWNNKKAADKWRRSEAGYLIRSIVVRFIETPKQEPVRAFVNVGSPNDPKFNTIVNAMSEKESRERVLTRAKNELRSWKNRYKTLTEFAALIDIIDETTGD